jgi:hypothetical protein
MELGNDFLGKLVLLFLGAVVTGLGVPYVFRQVDARRFKDQKRYEAELARQGKVFEARVKLLERLSTLLWRFQMAAIEVTYYKGASSDRLLYDNALKQYEAKAGHLLGGIRAEISKSLRLTKPETYSALKNLYYDGLLGLDSQLNSLVEGKTKDWSAFNRYLVHDFGDRVDKILDDLAEELRLKDEGQTSIRGMATIRDKLGHRGD